VRKKKFSEATPQRPGYGVCGREVVLWANYFELHSSKDLELYRYSVAIAADGRGRVPVGKRAQRIVLEEHFLPHGHNIATDFKSNLISRDELDLDKDEHKVAYRSEEEDVPAPNAPQYRCRVQFTGSLTLSELGRQHNSSKFSKRSSPYIFDILHYSVCRLAKIFPSTFHQTVADGV
jgi:hypothetical protein